MSHSHQRPPHPGMPALMQPPGGTTTLQLFGDGSAAASGSGHSPGPSPVLHLQSPSKFWTAEAAGEKAKSELPSAKSFERTKLELFSSLAACGDEGASTHAYLDKLANRSGPRVSAPHEITSQISAHFPYCVPNISRPPAHCHTWKRRSRTGFTTKPGASLHARKRLGLSLALAPRPLRLAV